MGKEQPSEVLKFQKILTEMTAALKAGKPFNAYLTADDFKTLVLGGLVTQAEEIEALGIKLSLNHGNLSVVIKKNTDVTVQAKGLVQRRIEKEVLGKKISAWSPGLGVNLAVKARNSTSQPNRITVDKGNVHINFDKPLGFDAENHFNVDTSHLENSLEGFGLFRLIRTGLKKEMAKHDVDITSLGLRIRFSQDMIHMNVGGKTIKKLS